jgi:hypothetical protein
VLVFARVLLEERGLQRGGKGLDEGGAGDDAGGGNHVFHPGVLLLRQEPENRLQSVLRIRDFYPESRILIFIHPGS